MRWPPDPRPLDVKNVRRQAASASTQSTRGEEVQTTAPENVLRELANALEQTGRAMPAIRKIRLTDGALHISVHDVIVAIKGYSQQNAAQEFKRRGVGAPGVPPKWLTEVADFPQRNQAAACRAPCAAGFRR